MLKIFNQLFAEGRVEISRLTNTRVKVHTPCQWMCSFCHMEGNHNSVSIRDKKALEDTILAFRDKFGFNDVHFTGGEPSIHPKIVDYVSLSKQHGFTVKMTTNAQASIERFFDLVAAGLSEVNVSMHTLSGRSLAEVMHPPRNILWGERAIAKQMDVVSALKSSLSFKINTVAGDDIASVLQIAEFARGSGVSWRVMDELDHPEISFATIMTVAEELKAVPTMAHLIQGSSSCAVTMTCPDGFSFKVKMIRPFKLKGMCDNCQVDAVGKCKEYAYGPRLEGESSGIKVRSCLYRSGEGYVQSVGAYLNHQFATSLLSEM